MELLVPGLILVALMVYASTKIKRNTAKAYEEEKIEGDGFSLIKPDGFLHKMNTSDGSDFEAYSKDFGIDNAENRHRAILKLQSTGDDIASVRKAIRATAESIAEDPESGVLEVERTDDGFPVNAFYKFEKNNGKLYELQAVVLREHKDDYLRKVQRLFESLQIR
jgi:hypothetical protein